MLRYIAFQEVIFAGCLLPERAICSYFVLMPETNGKRKGPYAFTLLKAFEQGRLVRARCHHCNIRRVYDPGDLKQLVGDVDIDSLRKQMRCEKCGKREFMDVEFWSPTGQEWEGLIVRRLVGTRMNRKVIWRDEPARR